MRFAYEWHDDSGNWYRSHGNEQWEFDESGFMRRREASINDVPIAEKDRLFHWPLGPRPADHKGLSEGLSLTSPRVRGESRARPGGCLEISSLRGAKRRSNPVGAAALDCFAEFIIGPAMSGRTRARNDKPRRMGKAKRTHART